MPFLLPPGTPEQRKALGAYYTEARVARALCRWAVRRGGERVLDPAFGGGVFVRQALLRGAELGGVSVAGVELEERAFDALAAASAGAASSELIRGSVLNVRPCALGLFDAVVGNPPFIRFQRLSAQARREARDAAADAGVELSPLAGSWVAFTVHAGTFLSPGGRLALVVPAEAGHAPSARPLLRHLRENFAEVTFVTFRSPLFHSLDQDVLLLLASGKGGGPADFRGLVLSGPEALDAPLPCRGDRQLTAGALLGGVESLSAQLLSPDALELYRRLGSADGVRLGDIASVESGYVTGANAHFHLSPERADALGLPAASLVPTVFRSRALSGLLFDEERWRGAAAAGRAGYLAQVAGFEGEPGVRRFLRELEEAGVHRRYKARTRSPWYRVARVGSPPLLLASVGADGLPLAVNRAGASAPNTFHAVTPATGVDALALAAAWHTSLGALSLELEGHALGGGLLKLDPGEALRVLLPEPRPLPEAALQALDAALAAGEPDRARSIADELLLLDTGLLTAAELETVRRATAQLRELRRPPRKRAARSILSS